MNRIFISYKRVDKDRVFEIRKLIESRIGEECWIDLEGIESDAQFKDVIIKAINNCEVVLFMYSKAHSEIRDFEKDWTICELNYASFKNKRIVFVNIDGTPLTDEFMFDYGLKQQVDARSSDALDRLIKDLHKWLDIPIPPKPDDPTPPVKPKKGTKESEEASKADPKKDTEKDPLKELYDKGHNYELSGNYSEAAKCYSKAAEQGYAPAQYSLAAMFKKGQGVAQNYSEALKWYRKAAEQNIVSAQNDLGWMYNYGYGVDQDYSEAVKWYRKAAEQGNANAQNNVGWMYQYGYGVEQDYSEAEKWYRKAAEQGLALAQNNLGIIFHHGYGVEQDYAESKKWLRKAAEQGHASAKYMLDLYATRAKRACTKHNEAGKTEHFESSDNSKDTPLLHKEKSFKRFVRKTFSPGKIYLTLLCLLLLAGGIGLTLYYENQESPKELFNKGYECYDSGDYQNAVRYFREAAKQGHPDSQYSLGECYYYGTGVEQNYTKATEWYSKAAEQGHSGAQFSLGFCHENGIGFTQDYSEAEKWYRKAGYR